MTTSDLDIHEMVRQLTLTHTHREPYIKDRELPDRPGTWVPDGERNHVSDVPALVVQLLAEEPPGITNSGDLAGTGATSRPTARIEALDTVMLIDDEAGQWILRLGGRVPRDEVDPVTLLTRVGVGTLRRLRRLHGLYPSAMACDRPKHRKHDIDGWCCDRGHLEYDVRRWWHQARIIVGWDMAAWVPNNTCPVCDERRKLRIRLDSALCVECRTLWTEDQLGLLAEHIRAENADEGEPAEDCA